MKFCENCNNLLYFSETENGILLKCHNCGFSQENDNNVLSTNLYKSNETESSQTNQYCIYDPSLPRTIHRQCPNEKCQSIKDKSLQEAVFITDKVTLQQIFICCICKTEWKYS